MSTRQTIRRKEWFDDGALWRDLYPFIFPERRFADAAEEIDKVLALTKIKGGSVLDLCCGPGRSSIWNMQVSRM